MDVKPGDFILTRGDYWVSTLIRFGQDVRKEARYATWNHAALVIDEDGTLAEALSDGVVKTHISRYDERNYLLVRIDANDHDRQQIRDFALSVLEARWKYSWLTIAAIALQLLTKSTLTFSRTNTAICSGFVAEALRAAGYIFPKPPGVMMPADLAEHFERLSA